MTFDYALDTVESLPLLQQEELLYVLNRRLIEKRRDEIAKSASEANALFNEGKLTPETPEELKERLVKQNVT